MNHLFEARQLKEDFMEETRGFSVFEVERIWEEHSERSAAGWLIPQKDEVESVFNSFRFTEGE